MAKITLFELKEKMATLSAAIATDAEWIAEKAADPNVAMKDIEEKKAHRDELTARYEMLKAQHDELEEKQRTELAIKAGKSPLMDETQVKIAAKAAFYRAALTGGEIGKAYQGLGGLPAGSADLGNGDHLLPTHVSNELITQPLEENSLRQIELTSQINGLEEPVLNFTIEDEDLEDVLDTETAREIEISGDTVAYGRFKTKITATIKDTVLHGTDTNLVTEVENGLRSGLATKEKMRAFAQTPDDTHKHMSFYGVGIKEVEGADLITAIINAWADLPDAFGNRAAVVMRKTDYYAAIRQLAGTEGNLWGKKPEDVLGIPVIFNDRAETPVVGDFSYARQNYDIGAIYETDKDAKKGEYYFVLTAWGDHRIRLKSAFRLAKVATVNP